MLFSKIVHRNEIVKKGITRNIINRPHTVLFQNMLTIFKKFREKY